MRRNLPRFVVAVVGLALLASVRAVSLAAQDRPQAMFINLSDSVPGSLQEITGALRAGFAGAGWEVLADYAVGVDSGSCGYGARVLALHSSHYSRVVLARGPRAAFALPIRLVVFQDEAGSHVAMASPLSINRTIVAEYGFEEESEAVVAEVSRIVRDGLRGVPTRRQYGQVRDRGYIGRTMGIMAGGPFLEKVSTVFVTPGDSPEDLRRVAGQIWQAARRPAGRGRWQLGGVYRLDLADQGVVIIGLGGAAMEARAFQIVGAGGDRSRRSFRCPGLAYGAAFPLEIVVMRDSGQIRVTLMNEMYRMKMFFEDAGKMKFAANMGMPGSIEGEIRSVITAGVGQQQ